MAPSEKPENNGKEQGLEQAGGSGDRHNLWGIWEISVDPVTEEVSIEPKREAVAHFNI